MFRYYDNVSFTVGNALNRKGELIASLYITELPLEKEITFPDDIVRLELMECHYEGENMYLEKITIHVGLCNEFRLKKYWA